MNCGLGPNQAGDVVSLALRSKLDVVLPVNKRAGVQTPPATNQVVFGRGAFVMAESTSIRERNSIAKKQLALRNSLWPDAESLVWRRSVNKGFTTIPKTMPIILQIMDALSSGKPVSSTYMTLWCAQWDDSFVSISKPGEMAYAAGFSGQRSVATWSARMRILNHLGFILLKPRSGQEIGYALIMNPHTVIKDHHKRKTPGLSESLYSALLERALEVGASDMK